MNCLFIGFTLFFFNDTATTEIYTLSLHDALPISSTPLKRTKDSFWLTDGATHRPVIEKSPLANGRRSEEHTSELQSRRDLVCRLLLEKKKKKKYNVIIAQTERQDTSSSQSIKLDT